MIIRSNVITWADIAAAFRNAREVNRADIYFRDSRGFRPRRRYTYGYELYAYSYGGRRRSAHDDCLHAASWSDYGYVIARLYATDPAAQIGHYLSDADFANQVRHAADYARRGNARRNEDISFLALLRPANSIHTQR